MYKAIIEVLSSLTPIVIAAIVVYIAWQQHLTNKNRLKMELFDKKYKIYEVVIEAITTKFDDFHKDTAILLHRDLSSTRFLFRSKENEDLEYKYLDKEDLEDEGLDKEVLNFVKKVLEAAKGIANFREDKKTLDGEYIKYEDLGANQKQANVFWKNIGGLRREAINVFSKHLTLNAHWKYRQHAMIVALVVGGLVLLIWLVNCWLEFYDVGC